MTDSTIHDESTVSRQARISALGEVSGFVVGIGAVYLAEGLCPRQTHGFIERLSAKLGKWRGTSASSQQKLAHDITDVVIMNVGGFVNMGAQFFLHRHAQQPEERAPLAYDFGRVLTGRVAGTATAVGALALAKTFQPRRLTRAASDTSRLLGNYSRLADLAVSNGIQSVGALAGNVPAQLLYDQLVGPARARR